MPVAISFFQKTATCLVAGLTAAAFWLLLGNGGGIPWLPAALVFALVGLSLAAAGGLLVWWQVGEGRWGAIARANHLLQVAIRWLAAFNIASFGWKKLLGLQFIVPLHIAQQPMNQQSGEWLTWFYFGYSPAFGVLLAVIQLVGAGLLLFNRTLLLGAIILAALLVNITLINICYHLNAGALTQSVIATIDVVFLLGLHYRRLMAIFLPAGELAAPTRVLSLRRMVWPLALFLSLGFTLYLRKILM